MRRNETGVCVYAEVVVQLPAVRAIIRFGLWCRMQRCSRKRVQDDIKCCPPLHHPEASVWLRLSTTHFGGTDNTCGSTKPVAKLMLKVGATSKRRDQRAGAPDPRVSQDPDEEPVAHRLVACSTSTAAIIIGDKGVGRMQGGEVHGDEAANQCTPAEGRRLCARAEHGTPRSACWPASITLTWSRTALGVVLTWVLVGILDVVKRGFPYVGRQGLPQEAGDAVHLRPQCRGSRLASLIMDQLLCFER